MNIPPNRFRFRAWDKRYKKMRYNVTPSIGLFDPVTGEVFEDTVDLNDTPEYDTHAGGAKYGIAEGMFVLMQSTGMADKKGKEIFEGDIVEGHSAMVSHSKWIVEWGDKRWEIRPLEMLGALDTVGYPLSILVTPKVVGNIYEKGSKK